MNKSFNETRFMECLGFERQFFMLFLVLAAFYGVKFFHLTKRRAEIYAIRIETFFGRRRI